MTGSDAEVTVVKSCGNQWNDEDCTGFAEAIEAAKNADAVILCVGAGDLYVTVYGGRTRLVGILLGRGLNIDEAKEELNGVTLNNWMICYQGMHLIYSLKTGAGCYWRPKLNGGTVIRITSDGVSDVYYKYVDVTEIC